MIKTKIRAVAAVSVVAISGLAHAELDANQKKWLAEASKYLDQAEANLKTAKDGVGSGPVTPSKAKLALTRLGAVKTAIGNANARLEKMPADDVGAAPVIARAKAVEEAVSSFEQSLANPGDAPSAPQPQPQTPGAAGETAAQAPSAPAAGAKLNYKQEESLKNARFHAREVVGRAQALAALAEKVSKAADPSAVDVRELQAGVNVIADAKQKAKNAADQLASVPSDGQGVPEVVAALQQAVASIGASEKVIAPAFKSTAGKLDPANLPNLEPDLKRLSELGRMYADEQVWQQNRARAAELVALLPEAIKEHDRIQAEYALLVQQQTEIGKRIQGSGNHFKQQVARFQAEMTQQKTSLPAEIDADIADASSQADKAVQESRPLYFAEGSAVPQRMGWAEEKLVVLKAIDAAAGKVAEEKIEVARKTLKEREASLREGIIAAARPPADNYQGSDRADLEKRAIETWKAEAGVDSVEVLLIRIPGEAWERETLWRWENREWRFIDRSRLQVQLILKQDDKLAVNRPVNFTKDHTAGDKIVSYPFDSKTDEVPPQRLYLLGNIKK